MIVVVDYQKGNLLSVQRGLQAVGAAARITSDPKEIAAASAIVLPGVGAFADAAATMCQLGQMEVIRERVRTGVPFLGICLGMHLMFAEGLEGSPAEKGEAARYAAGLGLIPGVVDALPREDAEGVSYKIPHVGWNSLVYPEAAKSALFQNIPEGEYFYFTHSYVVPAGPSSIALTTHSITFPSAVQLGECAYGVQFHPEKSSDAGLLLLKNFVTLAKEA